jgi:hypothetical protein
MVHARRHQEQSHGMKEMSQKWRNIKEILNRYLQWEYKGIPAVILSAIFQYVQKTEDENY